jgi:hypothetical protein
MFIKIMYKSLVSTSQKTQAVSIIETKYVTSV